MNHTTSHKHSNRTRKKEEESETAERSKRLCDCFQLLKHSKLAIDSARRRREKNTIDEGPRGKEKEAITASKFKDGHIQSIF